MIVTGGIAAYKSAFLVRLLKRGGAEVRVVMSKAAVEFVAPLTFEVLSGNPVHTGLFERSGPEVEHVELAGWAERAVVAPATADILAKAAVGLADDLAGTVLVALRCPVFFAPSMNDAMWENPTVRRNISTLKKDGRNFIEPGSGELACGERGHGRMAEPAEIMDALVSSFEGGDLSGVRFLVTAGRTEEEIDPVRYISNRSSGRMGFAVAAGAKGRGARVRLVHGSVDVAVPDVDSVKRVKTAAQMKASVVRSFRQCDVLVMAAAVADFTPAGRAAKKIKRSADRLTVELRPTTDILGALKERKRQGQVVVGFALETDDAEKSTLGKIRDKGCDYMVLNRVGDDTGFNVDTNQITLYKGNKQIFSTPVITKAEAASMILDAIASDKRLERASK